MHYVNQIEHTEDSRIRPEPNQPRAESIRWNVLIVVGKTSLCTAIQCIEIPIRRISSHCYQDGIIKACQIWAV